MELYSLRKGVANDTTLIYRKVDAYQVLTESFKNITVLKTADEKGTVFGYMCFVGTADSIRDSRPSANEKLQKPPSWPVV